MADIVATVSEPAHRILAAHRIERLACPHSARPSSTVAQIEGVRPGEGFGASSPVCLLLLGYLSIVGIETPKILTTSLREMPRFTASRIFILRSSE